MRLLDTDVMVDLRRQFPPALAWFDGLVEEPMVPGFVLLEVMEGCRNLREMRRLQRDLAPFTVVWPTAADCERALRTFAEGYLRHGLGLLDSVIGECAVGQGAVLCTFNLRHFRAVPGLVTEQPYQRRNV
jgi:predicted nucleic acid-binding protein